MSWLGLIEEGRGQCKPYSRRRKLQNYLNEAVSNQLTDVGRGGEYVMGGGGGGGSEFVDI
jgi:hypothetical protein